MKGVITKKHWLSVWKAFGWRKAIRLLISRRPTALAMLMI
uniref:Uncharacterized protein n=1 Tax=viral metagenome TaxID=1070528 RepID=A0A6M3JLB9_9ZZZZ